MPIITDTLSRHAISRIPEVLMTTNENLQPAKVEKARDLARRLYDYDLKELENLPEEERERLKASFRQLSRAEFEDVLRQVIAAKRQEQTQVGWQTIPHDLAVIVTVIIIALVDLRTGLAVGIGVLVLLESLSMTLFDERIYRPLSLLVWLTYPAYALLAYTLYRRGYEPLVIAGVVLFVWPGMFLLGALARVPLHLLWEERERQQASRE